MKGEEERERLTRRKGGGEEGATYEKSDPD